MAFDFILNMVCNVRMKTPKQIIDSHGGPAKLAEKLGFDKRRGGIQRIHNWETRGIPPSIVLQFPDVFLPDVINIKGKD